MGVESLKRLQAQITSFAAVRRATLCLRAKVRRGKNMRDAIHPDYERCVVKCACGETFETGSVRKNLNVDICSACHPFYTGRQKLVDKGGRVDKFKRRMEQAKG